MRRLILTSLLGGLVVAAPGTLRAQTVTPLSASSTPSTVSTPSTPSGAQAYTQAPASAAPADDAESSRSLFEPSSKQFQIGGRFSS